MQKHHHLPVPIQQQAILRHHSCEAAQEVDHPPPRLGRTSRRLHAHHQLHAFSSSEPGLQLLAAALEGDGFGRVIEGVSRELRTKKASLMSLQRSAGCTEKTT